MLYLFFLQSIAEGSCGLDKSKNESFKRKKVKRGLEKNPFSLSTSIQLLGKDPKSWDTIYIEGRTQNLSISVIDGSKCSPNFK